MSLSTALNIAQSSLRSVTRQTSVVSNNITNAGNENYTRRSADLEGLNSGTRVVSIRRHADEELLRSSLGALSANDAQQTLSSRINSLQSAIMGANGEASPSTYLANFHNAMQVYSANPSNGLLGEAAVNSAKDLVRRLNEASQTLQSFRTSMDAEISAGVDKLNGLLADFYDANIEVTEATQVGADPSDALDRRDTLLKEISKLVPVTTLVRGNNDMVLMTRGATLFETVPRSVTFQPQSSYDASVTGNLVRVDGVPIPVGTGGDTTGSGSLAAMVQLRDDVAVNMQSQLDEVARGLIEAFAERDPAGGGLPPLTGLFTYPGGPAMPAGGTLMPGLAQSISVNTLFDPAVGGNANLLRDGGANGAGYVENTTGAASFADRLIGYSQGLDQPLAFDPASGVGGSRSVLSYATETVNWLEGYRSTASTAASKKEALHVRLSTSLNAETGVNLDEEMSRLLDLEHTFEASARLISVVDEMLRDLLAAVR